MKLKKVGIAVIACALAVFTLGAVSGCGQSPEDSIREAITKEFDSFKHKDDEAIQQVAQSAESQSLSQYGIENEEFANMVLDGFDYHINDINVDGSTATANITIVSKSATAFKEKLTGAIAEISADPNLATMSNEEKVERISQAITDSFQDIAIINEDVTIEYQQKDNVWTPINSGSALGSLDSVVFAQSV